MQTTGYESEGLPKGSPDYISRLNKIKILGLIREYGSISRADIVKMTALSAPTVSRIVNGLIAEEKLVSAIGMGDSSGGRPPVMYKFNGDTSYVIGMDLGATTTRGVLSDLNGNFIEEIDFQTRLSDGPAEIIEDVVQVIRKLATSKKKSAGSRIFGVGIAVAGLIDVQNELIVYSPDFNWHNIDLIGALRDKIDFPVIFDNVTRLMALGGLRYGEALKAKNFICINVGYGIGSGILVHGEILRGRDGFAGEFGHITIDKESDILCNCGNYGCLEALASGKAIAITAQSRLARGQKSLLLELSGGDINQVTAKMVADAAKEGDELSLNVFNKAIEYIGIGIADLVNLFNPEMILIGGGVSMAGEMFFDHIKEVIHRHILQPSAHDLKILPVAFGKNAALMGAFALVLNRILNLDMVSGKSSKFVSSYKLKEN